MKRFIIMAGNDDDCRFSGWDSYYGTCDTYEQAMDSVPPLAIEKFEWWQIVDMTDGKIIRRSYD